MEPIPELDDEVARLNDPSSYKSLKKDDYVLYLENDELLSDDDSEGRKQKAANTLSIPDHQMLSEISEEDDLSMLSERGVHSPKKSRKTSKQPSQQITKQKALQILATQASAHQEGGRSGIGRNNEQENIIPSNQQDVESNPLSRSAQNIKMRTREQMRLINTQNY